MSDEKRGKVYQLSASRGGVPKMPIREANVSERGFTVDAQADQRAHGGPDQALCLWSNEVIEGLRAEGHDVFPGATGENVTTAGVDWAEVVPGCRLRLGPDVVVEVTRYATPCWKNSRWFKDGDFNRMHHAEHPGESRVYARVVQEGMVQMGDPVVLLGATARERLERQRIKSFRWPQDF